MENPELGGTDGYRVALVHDVKDRITNCYCRCFIHRTSVADSTGACVLCVHRTGDRRGVGALPQSVCSHCSVQAHDSDDDQHDAGNKGRIHGALDVRRMTWREAGVLNNELCHSIPRHTTSNDTSVGIVRTHG